MNLHSLATAGNTPACFENQALFSAAALDYNPRDEAYSNLTPEEHAALAENKVAAEEAAVDVCFGCPLMLACEQDDKERDNHAIFISGVIGGRTEAERKARRAGRTFVPAQKTTSIPNPQVAPGDRGPRNQVDDELVATLTKAGKTSEEIAVIMGCSTRTISRARNRLKLNQPAPALSAPAGTDIKTAAADTDKAPATNKVVINTETNALFADSAADATASRTRAAINNAPRHTPRPRPTKRATVAPCRTTTDPFDSGRRVSSFMHAVYDHLVQVGGSDTLDHLVDAGVPHVNDDEAISFWESKNSTTLDGVKVLRSGKTNTPRHEQIAQGARAKVHNAIDATQRKGRYLTRDGDTYIFKAEAHQAWVMRTAAKQQASRTLTAAAVSA